MPGLLSQIFDMRGPDGENDGGSSGRSQETEAGGHLDLDPSVSIHTESGGSYENADGSTTTWSRSEDLSVNADVDAIVRVIDTSESQSFDGG